MSELAFPALVGDAALGSVKEWFAEVRAEGDDPAGPAVVSIRFGAQGGKQQVTTKRYTAGKNAGKSNATTPFQQAVSETRRRWLDKIQKQGYKRADGGSPSAEASEEQEAGAAQEAGEEADGGGEEEQAAAQVSAKRRRVKVALLPMLAKPFDASKLDSTRAKTIKFPCIAQPKLDGLRCLIYRDETSGQLVAQSRVGGNFTTVGHILEELRGVFDAWEGATPSAARPKAERSEAAMGSAEHRPAPNRGRLVLDGELFTFDTAFEVLAGKLKRQDAAPVMEATFHAYDMFILDGAAAAKKSPVQPIPCETRISMLSTLLSARSPSLAHVKLVETRPCGSLEEMRAMFAEFTAAGYEGIMLRNTAAPYKLGFRSPDLQKYKEFCEEEFEIVGYTEAEGRDAGTVVFTCRTNVPHPETGKHEIFAVRPRGTFEHRAQLLASAEALVRDRAKLTVIYQELSCHNVPRFPVGKDVRGGGTGIGY